MSTSPVEIDEEVLADLLAGRIRLDRGSHKSWKDGHCAMEVVSRLAKEGHTDAPECASPVLRRFMIRLNDRWLHEQRQQLIPYLPRMIGTAGDGLDDARIQIAREATAELVPSWLRLAGMDAEADAIAQAARAGIGLHPSLSAVSWAAWEKRNAALQKIRDQVEEKLAGRAAAADASAAAVADAAADAVASAVADADPWRPWDAAYAAAKPIFDKAIQESTAPGWVAVRELAAAQRGVAMQLLERLIDPTKESAA